VKAVLAGCAIALVAASAASGATVRLHPPDASSYPALRATVVAPVGSKAPRLLENGHPVVGLSAVNLGGTKSIVIAIDRSQSMRGKPLASAIAAAQAFAAAARADDHVGVVAFGRAAVGLTSPTSGPAAARDQLGGISVDPKSGTALYDAITVAADRLAGDERPGRAIVVMTDGTDVSSLHSFRDAVKAAQHARAAVYTIGIAGPSFTSAVLRDIAQQTGGTYHEASSSHDLAATYAAVQRELARTWQVSYLTSARPGSTVAMTAIVPGAGRATVKSVLPDDGSTAVDAPSGLIPSFAYSAAGTAVLGLAVGGLILLSACFWFASRRTSRLRERIEPHLAHDAASAKLRRQQGRAATRARLVDSIESAFKNVRQFRQISRMIERADIPLRPGELVAICAGTGLVLGLVTAVAGLSSLMTLAIMAIGASVPLGVVSYKARKRIGRFENQLPDLLITLAASLKAGHSFRQGIQSVVEEGAEPASSEFKRVLTETQLGKPMDDALAHMAERVGSNNFTFVITAVTIQRQIGGSLAGLFDMVGETVRQRQQFARKVKGLTAMGRMSAYVLVGLPFFLAAAISLMNPVYMSPLWHTSIGHKMVFSGLFMITIGSLMLRKIASFRG
jgi:tight adherence protein B